MSTSVSSLITVGAFAEWHHVFQGQNLSWFNDQRIISGNFFLGLQGQTAQIFPDLAIPKGAIIEQATMVVTAFQNSAPAYTTFLGTPVRGFGQAKAPFNNASQPHRGWRADQWSNADMEVRHNNAAGLMIETSGGVSNSQWHYRLLSGFGAPAGEQFRERMGQKFTVPAGTSAERTVSLVTLQMLRSTPAPVGSVRLEIMATAPTLGPTIPDETVIATSAPVLMSTLSGGAAAPVSFTFTGADLVELTAGSEFAITVRPDVFVGSLFGPFIAMRHQNAFLTAGRLMHFGTGTGLDYQNFPGTVDANQASQIGQTAATIAWAVPAFVAGFSAITPDLSTLVQVQVNDPFYTSSRDIIITTGGNTGTANRVWRHPTHVVGPGPRLNVTYRERRASVN